MSRLRRLATQLWPVLAMLAGALLTQNRWFGRYDEAGHAGEHVSSATAIIPIGFLLAVIVWSVRLPPRDRAVTGALALVMVGAMSRVTAGNLRVVEAIGGEDWSLEEADSLGPSRPGFVSGHDLAETWMWIVVAAALALMGWLRWRRAISSRTTIAAVALSVLFPPWLLPGAGIAVVALSGIVHRVRRPADPEP